MFKKIILTLVLALNLLLLTPTLVLAVGPLPQTPQFNSKSYGVGLESAWYTFDLSVITHDGVEDAVVTEYKQNGLMYYFNRVIMIMTSLIGTTSILVMVYGGFLILTSAGIQDQYDQGKNFIKYAAIGLLVGLSAYILVSLVQVFINTIFYKSA